MKKTHHINKANWLILFITTNIILRIDLNHFGLVLVAFGLTDG